MLNSDRDLDLNSNRCIAGSPWQSLCTEPSIASESSIEQSKALSIFTAACAQATLLIDAPVAILTTVGGSGERIASISGAQHLVKLPANPNLSVELGGLEYCHDRIVTTGSKFIADCQHHPQLSASALYLVHSIHAYLGVPIITAAGDRLGTLCVLDLQSRHFSDRDGDILQLVGNLVASEFERSLLSQAQLTRSLGGLHYRLLSQRCNSLLLSETLREREGFANESEGTSELCASRQQFALGGYPDDSSGSRQAASCSIAGFDDRSVASEHLATTSHRHEIDPRASYPYLQGEIQFKLLAHLAQELRTPLTSILGMTSVLQQEIYGSLSGKQKDYLGIVYHSGQQLVALVDEIAQLGSFERSLDRDRLQVKSVDLEMLCQSAMRTLEPIAKKKQQHLLLDLAGEVGETTSPVCRIWLLDKQKVRQIVYYLCLSSIHASANGSCISIELINLPTAFQLQIRSTDTDACIRSPYTLADLDRLILDPSVAGEIEQSGRDLRVDLGLALAHLLAIAHGGNIEIDERGCGYCLTLPLLVDPSR